MKVEQIRPFYFVAGTREWGRHISGKRLVHLRGGNFC